MEPVVSVITPVRNCEGFLEPALRSVLEQSFGELELLVTDDGSTDGSSRFLESLSAEDERVRVFRRPGTGDAAQARNVALANARGRYLAFLDSDDVWLPWKLERQLNFMRSRGSYFSYTAYEKMDEAGRRADRVVEVPTRMDYPTLLKGCAIGCSTVMIDRHQTGPVRLPVIKRGHDYLCWLRLVAEHGAADGLNEPLTLYRERKGSLSANKLKKAWMNWRIYRHEEALPFWRAIGCMACYCVHGVRKRLI